MFNSSLINQSWKLAMAPANFIVQQNLKAWDAWSQLAENYQQIDEDLVQAQQQALTQIKQIVTEAEASLPRSIESLTDQERQNIIFTSLEKAQSHLLYTIGELYKAVRVMSVEPGRIIEHEAEAKRIPKPIK